MENLVIDSSFWKNKRVAITGHTGFKGGWISLWLSKLGAHVSGFSLTPNTSPNLFEILDLESLVEHHCIGDIRDYNQINQFLDDSKPDIVIHMAAQALVRASYHDPLETISTNVMGTANLLQACREHINIKAIVNVTSDKCYQNNEDGKAFVESDPMGGHDVYSASKGAAELIAHAFDKSFFQVSNYALASVRAGNVIGGGDWSDDRLVPDYFRSVAASQPLTIRSPNAVRPWQHVLEPISGYLCVAERMFNDGSKFGGGWNFGPTKGSVKTVQWIIDYLISLNGGHVIYETSQQLPEAKLLELNSDKASQQLGWTPQWTIEQALDNTAQWEQERLLGKNMTDFSLKQIEAYMMVGEE